jgi:uncharacterized protein
MPGYLLAAAFLVGLSGCGEADPVGASPTLAAGRPLPELTARVVDRASLLPPATELDLTGKLAALERRTTDQLVIVTVPGLRGEPIEQLGRRLGNGWGIGQKDKNNGVLLIVAPGDRKVRIEVGLGLERTLPDELCAEIIRRDILPHFREGQFESGIVAGSDAIIRSLDAAASPGKGAA